MSDASTVSLIVRRTIAAPAERLFAAFTEPLQLVKWWGPGDVTCPEAEVDLRVGGRYRIANLTPSGQVIWITGEFEEVEPPRRLVYTFNIDEEGRPAPTSRVTVRFEALGQRLTEVVLVHDRIAGEQRRSSHQQGWLGCLHGLQRFVEVGMAPTGPRRA